MYSITKKIKFRRNHKIHIESIDLGTAASYEEAEQTIKNLFDEEYPGSEFFNRHLAKSTLFSFETISPLTEYDGINVEFLKRRIAKQNDKELLIFMGKCNYHIDPFQITTIFTDYCALQIN